MPSLVRLAFHGLLELVAPPTCAACGASFVAASSTGPTMVAGFCGACGPLVERVPGSLGLSVAYAFGGPLGDAIRRFKYGGRSELGSPLGELLATAALDLSGRIDLVVPVPLHVTRLRERGFDQTALLSAPVARRLGARRAVEGLRRVRSTAVQASLARANRVDNVRGAFRAAPVVRGARVLLLDDVRTTGATLAEASAAVLAGGAATVHALALAGVEPGGNEDDA